MELDIGAFVSKPSIQQFNLFRKKDLLQIADILNISVSSSAAKKVIKAEVYAKLVEQGLLSVETDLEGEGKIDGLDMGGTMDFSSSKSDPLLLFKLKELELQIKQQEHENRRLHLRELEMIHIEKGKEREYAQTVISPVAIPMHVNVPPADQSTGNFAHIRDAVVPFDPSKHIKLVPPFQESEVDAYFIAFERIAAKLNWPRDMWALMMQCSLVGKAQEVCSALPIDDSLNYDVVKAAVLRVYELVPEAYRQKFRSYTKSMKQSFVGFARDKKMLLERWCAASKTTTFDQLHELFLLEDFKNGLPGNLVTYLNEQKENSLSAAAVLADEYMLTHKTAFSSVTGQNYSMSMFWNNEKPLFSRSMRHVAHFAEQSKEQGKNSENKRVCFYCLDPGHLIADCKVWKKKNMAVKPKSVANIVCEPMVNVEIEFFRCLCFYSFCIQG